MVSTNFFQQQLQNSCQAQFFTIGSQLKKGLFSIQDVGDYLPGNLMIHDLNSNANIYMNKSGCTILQHSREELQALGPAYFDKFFPKEEIKFLSLGIKQFIANNDHTCIHSFLQRVRPDSRCEYKWYFTSSRLCCTSDSTETNVIMHLAIEANTLSNLGHKLNKVFEENMFVSQNYRKFSSLTKREKEIVKLVALGNSSQNISDLLFISKNTVSNHRKNIMQKLEADCLSKLIRFAISFDLIYA